MKEISLEIKVQENQFHYFLELIEGLNFVKINKINGKKRSKAEFIESLKQSLKEVELHRQGKIKLQEANDFFNELEKELKTEKSI
jgi:hypothetical protein